MRVLLCWAEGYSDARALLNHWTGATFTAQRLAPVVP